VESGDFARDWGRVDREGGDEQVGNLNHNRCTGVRYFEAARRADLVRERNKYSRKRHNLHVLARTTFPSRSSPSCSSTPSTTLRTASEQVFRVCPFPIVPVQSLRTNRTSRLRCYPEERDRGESSVETQSSKEESISNLVDEFGLCRRFVITIDQHLEVVV
jgi:hypothetical protein